MPSLAERQKQFASAVRDATRPVPTGIVSPLSAARDERFAVYRNNVAVGLIEALRAAFPVVARLVGPEFFGAMARTHALRSLPASPVLLAYGADFPDFIGRFEPAAVLPYLADVAKLEWHWLESYHAADAASLAVAELQCVPRERLPGLRLTLHPSARVLSFEHPALTIWRTHREDEPAPLMLDAAREAVLLVRPCAHVEAIDLASGAVAFLTSLQAGLRVSEAAGIAMETQPGLDLAELLATLFGAGAFTGFIDGEDE